MSADRFPAVYVDCFSGAAGDMLVGALLDTGLPLDALRAELAKIPLEGYRVEATPVRQHHICGTHFEVHVEEHEHPHRHLGDIEDIFRRSSLPAADVARILAIFRRLGRAEAKVHGTSIEEVHFHEVGAVDSIIDIAGTVIALRLLGVERIFCSPLTLGSGTIHTAHGLLPVPAPATLEILAEAGAPTRPGQVESELVTPTGAAILCELAEFGRPAMRVRGVGYGFGTRELPWPNAVRLWLGELAGTSAPGDPDVVAELTCNLDDMSGEGLAFVMERLFAAGALDVWFTPIYMKKNRPAVGLSLLCHPAKADALTQLLLTHTTTLGVRQELLPRRIARRRAVIVETPWGPARAKAKLLDDAVVGISPEFEDCARLARGAGIPLAQVYEEVLAGYHAGRWQAEEGPAEKAGTHQHTEHEHRHIG